MAGEFLKCGCKTIIEWHIYCLFFYKIVMGKDHRGKPSGVNKSDDGTGVPAGGKFVEDNQRDEELTDKYTDNDDGIAGSVRQNNPNRNTDKGEATNAGGYKRGIS